MQPYTSLIMPSKEPPRESDAAPGLVQRRPNLANKDCPPPPILKLPALVNPSYAKKNSPEFYNFNRDADFDAQLVWLDSQYKTGALEAPLLSSTAGMPLLLTSPALQYHPMSELIAINIVGSPPVNHALNPTSLFAPKPKFKSPKPGIDLARAVAFLYRDQCPPRELAQLMPDDRKTSAATKESRTYETFILTNVKKSNSVNLRSCTQIAYWKLRSLLKDLRLREITRSKRRDFLQTRREVVMFIVETITADELYRAYTESWKVISFPFVLQTASRPDANEGLIRRNVLDLAKLGLAMHVEDIWRCCVQMSDGIEKPENYYEHVKTVWNAMPYSKTFETWDRKLEELPLFRPGIGDVIPKRAYKKRVAPSEDVEGIPVKRPYTKRAKLSDGV